MNETTELSRTDIDNHPSHLWVTMKRGHLKRTGHKLTGYVVVDADNVAHLERTCCN